MTFASLVLGSPAWLGVALALGATTLAVLVWSYRRTRAPLPLRCLLALLKATAVAIVLVCLVEPLVRGERPRPGANVFVVLSDDSQSLRIRDPGQPRTRAEVLQDRLDESTAWQTRLGQQFDVRRYRFAERLAAIEPGSPHEVTAEGTGSSLVTALQTVARRYRGQPVAGVLLLSDGNATDLPDEAVDWSQLPPVYAVPVGGEQPAPDVSLRSVAIAQTNFEQAPVTVRAEIDESGWAGRPLVVQLLDSAGKQVDEAVAEPAVEGGPRVVRFQLRPEQPGTSFYELRAVPQSESGAFDAPGRSSEATLENNRRLVAVDRPAGPYRVLYVAGRLNWEYKFLRRSLAADREIELVALVRIARREPKFSFLARAGESTNPLYRGFDPDDPEAAEQYDEPVLIRLGTSDAEELRDGFPQTADVLFGYDAVILDDVEAEFFTQDQLLLMQRFVSQRGGGLLMLGGAESLFQGGYARTPVGELLPVYLDRLPAVPAGAQYRLALTREGWLQPWVRLRETEDAERLRLAAMPAFETLNRVRGIKPGAEVLASVVAGDGSGELLPALVAQRFGKGRAGALLVGDYWRWSLRREPEVEDDLPRAWRQTVRWLVADVPGRVELVARPEQSVPGAPLRIAVEVRGPEYEPLDNAAVEVSVVGPDGQQHRLRAEPSGESAGLYLASYLPREPGAYRIQARAAAADGSLVGERQTGWAAEPAAAEFQQLAPNRTLLEQIAAGSGGELVELDRLERFVEDLPNKRIPVTEPWVYPLWHKPLVFLLAIGCLIAEWGLRRWRGLP